VTVSVDVTNSGARAGDEVIELYLTHEGVAGAPQRALKGFQRIHLAQGERRQVVFTLRDRTLAVVDDSGKHRIVPGMVAVWVGGGQPVSRQGLPPTAGLATRFTVHGSRLLPD
jgi:beta-glucosidase